MWNAAGRVTFHPFDLTPTRHLLRPAVLPILIQFHLLLLLLLILLLLPPTSLKSTSSLCCITNKLGSESTPTPARGSTVNSWGGGILQGSFPPFKVLKVNSFIYYPSPLPRLIFVELLASTRDSLSDFWDSLQPSTILNWTHARDK